MDSAKSKEFGKSLRTDTPRADQGIWKAKESRTDPVDLLKSQGESRIQSLLPVRYERMASSAFAFYRGAALIMAADLSTTSSTGIDVQVCGDAHVANFGAYASPSRRLIFDLNDFDETARGPWEWDLKRLVTSVEICGRDRGFNEKERRRAVLATARKYHDAMLNFAEMNTIDVWYAHIDVLNMLRNLQNADELSAKDGKVLGKALGKAYSKDSARAITKLTEVVDGRLRIINQPPLIEPLESLLPATKAEEAMAVLSSDLDRYAQTLAPDKRALFMQYTPADAGRKVVGVGSVGTRAWIVVMQGKDISDPLVLQVKEAQESVLERFVGTSIYENHGQRVVNGQRMMQSASDVMLGYTSGKSVDGHICDFYVRQLWDWKASTDLTTITPDELASLGEICGWTLARAHARSGDRFALAGYLGKNDTFDGSMVRFADSYADQNDVDYNRFITARTEGKLDIAETESVQQ